MHTRFRSLLADERGLTSTEHVLIAALFCAGTIVLLEALSHSLSDTLVYLGRPAKP
jgi:Flp pilus assembly pilin Flp